MTRQHLQDEARKQATAIAAGKTAAIAEIAAARRGIKPRTFGDFSHVMLQDRLDQVEAKERELREREPVLREQINR